MGLFWRVTARGEGRGARGEGRGAHGSMWGSSSVAVECGDMVEMALRAPKCVQKGCRKRVSDAVTNTHKRRWQAWRSTVNKQRHLGRVEQRVQQRAHGAGDERGVGGAVALQDAHNQHNRAFTDVPAATHSNNAREGNQFAV